MKSDNRNIFTKLGNELKGGSFSCNIPHIPQ